MERLLKPFMKNPQDMGIFQRMVSENFSHYRRDYAWAVFCLVIMAGITAFSAWLMGPVVKDVFYGNDMNQAVFLSSVVAAIFLVKGAVSYFQAVILNRIGNNMVARYQRRLFQHLLDLDVKFFAKQHSVSLIAQLNQNTNAVRDLLNNVVLGYARDLVTLIGLVGVMLYRDPYLALAILVIGPIALTTLARYARRVKVIAREEVHINSQVATAMQEVAHGIPVVKAFTMEEQLRVKLDALTVKAEGRSNNIARITARTSPLMETLSGLAIAAVISYGGWRVITQGYEPSDLTSFMTALLLAYDPAKKLAKLRVTLERSMVNARMIYEVLDTEIASKEAEAGVDLVMDGGAITFDNVTFSYDELPVEGATLRAPLPVIRDLSFVAEAGKTTALVGPSGGGKSTIIALLQRFYATEEGTISVDGQDISKVSTAALRSNIAYVSQAPVLFQGTVRDNLRYARPDATDAEIEQAAKNAQAHDFITALSKGYDTPLGENGANLSGGQRQRLSIARAIVRNAPILLLDEATSALDNQSEALVQTALDELMKGRTTLVIAHRLSTISNADRIIVIDNGEVVDQGRHDELVGRKRGVYARLHNVTG
ncbi:ABC transporter ATP-binding protein [Ahrensia sp. R2A130]|uniref:ABC transporter ATP-binding protein n=1 Tax=Ahrensia sp. R2A130 TaxID=744979 RepID=UPI0002EA0C0B|nr:ABC transporter ATP-binding protein [Ahrensia sp. R2A130]